MLLFMFSIYTESTIVVPIEDIGEIADPSLGVGQLHQENDVFWKEKLLVLFLLKDIFLA